MQNVVTYMGETIRKESALYASAGHGAASHVDARDIGAVGAKVLTESGHGGKAPELTGPVALTHDQIAGGLTTAPAPPVRYVPLPHPQYKQGATRGAPAPR